MIAHSLRNSADLLIKLFAFGLFLCIVLNWLNARPLAALQQFLNDLYDVFVEPVRRHIRPIRITPSAPGGLDLAPLVLLFIVWWLVHPFLMWVLS